MTRPGLVFCVLALGMVTVAISASAAPTFSVRRNTVLDQRPVWPGDFNGDGITDLVGSSIASRGAPPLVTVLLGRGDGTYGSPIKSTVAGDVYAVGDVNRDGKLDVLVQVFPQPDEDVTVLGGKGDGTFDTGHRVATVYQSTFGLLTDLDNDGNREVVVGGSPSENTGDAVLIFRGNGDFTFDLTPVVLQPMYTPMSGNAIDLDGDGRRDLVVANFYDFSITVLKNNGALNFTPTNVPTQGLGGTSVTAGDVNGDGKLDLVYTQTLGGDGFPWGEGYVYVALGKGDGTFGTPARYATPRGAWRVVVADVTRDGILDIVTANRSSIYIDDCGGGTLKTWDTVAVLTGVGDGTFRGLDLFSIGNQLNVESDRDRNAVSSLLISDVDGDGDTDLITSGGTIFITQPADPNWAPKVDLGPDQTYVGGSEGTILRALASDVDQDMLTYSWTSDTNELLPQIPSPCLGTLGYGTFNFTVTVDDGHGHQASDTIALTFVNPEESQPTLTIQAPVPNETIAASQPYTLKWHVHNPTGSIFEVTAYFSSDGGQTFNVAGNCERQSTTLTAEEDMTCVWDNPGPSTTDGRVLIKGFDDDAMLVTSAGVGPITIPSTSGLPSGWDNQDIGAVAATGDTTYSNGVFTIRGSGADIWGTADEFQYAYRSNTTGNVEIIARVDSVQNINAWTKAGIMLRQTLDAGSIHASLFVSPGKGVAFQRRTTTNGTSVHTAGPLITAPVWLRLTQVSTGSGSVVRAYYRRNANDAWTFIGDQVFTAGVFGNVGLAVSSHVDGTAATAEVSNVSISALPAWRATTIGAATGSASIGDDFATLKASGADIWGTADAFEFVHTAATDSIVARIDSVTNTNAWTKAGVMIREDLSADAAYVLVMLTPGKGVNMQFRVQKGAGSVQLAQVPGSAPLWIRLTKSGQQYNGDSSTDGVTWTRLGSVQFGANMSQIGLALTSHNPSATATAAFEGVDVMP